MSERVYISDDIGHSHGDEDGCGAPARAGGAGPLLRRCQRLRTLIDTIYDAYYDWDIHRGTIDFSAQIVNVLGVAPEALRRFSNWAELLHPDDREKTLDSLDKSAREARVFVDEYRMRRADGTYALIRDRGVTLLDETGKPARLVGVMRDVTTEREAELALRESAALYHTLFELASNPAFHVDQDGRYVNTNQAGASFLESTREELVDQTMAAHWGDDVIAAVRAVVSEGRSAARLDAEVQVNGTKKAAILSLVPCRVAGELACFVLATDITERQNLARTLEESNIALRVILEQRDRAREDLERAVAANIESVVLPLLTRLSSRIAGEPEAVLLDTALQNLREIVRPISPALEGEEGQSLTRREREIAHLIRAGKSSAEIAEALYISHETVAFHRKNLRRKLGLDGGATRLASYLAAPTGSASGRE